MNGNAYLSGTTSFLAEYNGTQYTSLASWKSAIGQEQNGIALTSNPCLAPTPVPSGVTPTNLKPVLAAYGLTPGSQCSGTALNLESVYSINPGTSDGVLATLPSPYSVGAITAGPGGTNISIAEHSDSRAMAGTAGPGSASGTIAIHSGTDSASV